MAQIGMKLDATAGNDAMETRCHARPTPAGQLQR
jgi:hypothetical protein